MLFGGRDHGGYNGVSFVEIDILFANRMRFSLVQNHLKGVSLRDHSPQLDRKTLLSDFFLSFTKYLVKY